MGTLQNKSMMTIGELYEEAEKNNHYSLKLLLDFLLYEKQIHTLSDDSKVLDKYVLPQHKERMNRLLAEYERSKGEN